MRRGLTLIEVVIATALLAIVVAATLPFFQSASGAFDSPGEASRDMALLGVLAARLPESPEWKNRGESTELSIEWPADLSERATASGFRGAPVRVHFPSSQPASDDSDAPAPEGAATATNFDGDWIEVACGEVTINRWISTPPRKRPRNSRPRNSRPRPRPHSFVASSRRKRVDRASPRLPCSARAFTLVETVIALALVSTLSLAAITWSVTAARLARVNGDRANLDEAARAVLRLINDDLHTFDRAPEAAARGTQGSPRARRSAGSIAQKQSDTPLRVRVEEGALVIETRARLNVQANSTGGSGAPLSGGHAIHRYSLDIERSELSLRVDGLVPRALITGAIGFESILDEEHRTLEVSITLEGGAVFTRSYVAP